MTSQTDSETAEATPTPYGMIAAGVAVILGVGYAAFVHFGAFGVGAYAAWLGSAVAVLALLGGDAGEGVDRSKPPSEVLEQARNDNGRK